MKLAEDVPLAKESNMGFAKVSAEKKKRKLQKIQQIQVVQRSLGGRILNWLFKLIGAFLPGERRGSQRLLGAYLQPLKKGIIPMGLCLWWWVRTWRRLKSNRLSSALSWVGAFSTSYPWHSSPCAITLPLVKELPNNLQH